MYVHIMIMYLCARAQETEIVELFDRWAGREGGEGEGASGGNGRQRGRGSGEEEGGEEEEEEEEEGLFKANAGG